MVIFSPFFDVEIDKKYVYINYLIDNFSISTTYLIENFRNKSEKIITFFRINLSNKNLINP